MKATIMRTDLLAALSRVYRVIEQHDDIPVLNNTLLRTGTTFIAFTGTDRCIEVSVKAPATVLEQGAMTVPARPLYEVARRLPEGAQVLLEANEKTLTIRAGRSRFSLQTLPESDFPLVASTDFACTLMVDATDLSHLFEQAQLAAADDVRMYLTGVYFHAMHSALRTVATDGHKMVQYDAQALNGLDGLPSVIVPRKTSAEICRLASDVGGNVTVQASKTRISFSAGGITLTSKLIDGTFPDYGRVIPLGNDKIFDVDRLALEAAVGRVAMVAGERGHAVKMEVEDGMLRLSISDAVTGSSASEEMDVEYFDEPVGVGLNPRHFLDILGRIGGDIVTVKLADEKTQMLVSDKDDERALFVLMPMRLG